MLVKIIKKEPNQNFGKKENGTTLSHTKEPIMVNRINLAFEDGQERGEENTLKSVEDEDSQQEKQLLKVVTTEEEIYTETVDEKPKDEEGLRISGVVEFPDFDYLDACVDIEEEM